MTNDWIVPEKSIPRGTTPTLRYKFNRVNVTDIAVAYMTLKQGSLTIEKTLADADVVHDEDNNYLDWRLTQAETLSISMKSNVEVQCRWKLADGTAGESPVTVTSPARILKEGEI